MTKLGVVDRRALNALTVFESYLDGMALRLELDAVAFEAWRSANSGVDPDSPSEDIGALLERDLLQRRIAELVETGRIPPSIRDGVLEATIGIAGAMIDVATTLPDVLRDIFDNPFRPVSLDPRWLTSTVVDLAGTIYEARAFDKMPILADALMDAGCDCETIIDHCWDRARTFAAAGWSICCWGRNEHFAVKRFPRIDGLTRIADNKIAAAIPYGVPMTPTLPELDLRQLSIDERISLVQAIWDNIEAESSGPMLTESQRIEIRRRIDEHRSNPNEVIPWEQIEAEARTRFQR